MKKVMNIAVRFSEMKESLFLLSLFVTSLIFRLPTLFNDFYDVDELAAIVQTREYLAGFRPGIDFKESKLPLYHSIFKFSYSIDGAYGWVIVHAITIVIVFLTAVAVYYIGKNLKDRKTGIIASLMYAVLISSFNRHFMAVNGEVIYNLPVTFGLLLLIMALKDNSIPKRILYLTGIIVSVFAAANVKFHGIILLLFLGFFFIVYVPYYTGNVRRVLLPYLVICALGLILFLTDYFVMKKFAPGVVKSLNGLLHYATASRSSNPLFMIGIYSYRQLTLGLWHFVLWIPVSVYLFRFIRGRFRRDSLEESAVALFGLITFLMVFGGGARVYYHYFMTSYPALSVIGAIALLTVDVNLVRRIYLRFTAAILIPGLFFLAWNFKDIYIKYYNQELFYDEPAALFWFRAIVVSSMDDYLLPNGIYNNTVKYIRENTSPADTIFVWGDGPHLYYFADRRIAIHHVWPKGSAIRIENDYKSGSPEAVKEAVGIQKSLISKMEEKKPALFVDTSPKGLHRGITRFGSFAKFPYAIPPLIRKNLGEHYRFEAVVDSYKIYRRVR